MKHWLIKLILVGAVVIGTPCAVRIFSVDNNHYNSTTLKTNLAATYEQEVANLYQSIWHRAPRPDEVNFHLKHQTPLPRLAAWLSNHPNTIQNCWYPKDITLEQVKLASNLFQEFSNQPVACDLLIAASLQQPTKIQFVNWLSYKAPNYLQPDSSQPNGDVSFVNMSGVTSTASLAFTPLALTASYNFNNQTYSDAVLASFNLPQPTGYYPSALQPPKV